MLLSKASQGFTGREINTPIMFCFRECSASTQYFFFLSLHTWNCFKNRIFFWIFAQEPSKEQRWCKTWDWRMGCKNDFQGHILKLPVLINQRYILHTITHFWSMLWQHQSFFWSRDFMVNGCIHDIDKMQPIPRSIQSKFYTMPQCIFHKYLERNYFFILIMNCNEVFAWYFSFYIYIY